MRMTLLGGAASIAILATPALSQATPVASGQQDLDAPLADSAAASSGNAPDPAAAPDTDASPIDTLEPADGAGTTPAPVAKTGNPVLDRLNELEAKVNALEARNRQLESQLGATNERVEKGEVKLAKAVQPNVAPTFADPGDNFTFKPRGMIELDYAGYNERAGGYDYSNGTSIRRGRFGFDGTFYKVFKWRLEAEFVGQQANLLDAYLQYVPSKNLILTVGQHKAPSGLEANSSDAFNEFLERGMANVAFGAVGAERRIGASATYQSDKLNAQIGVFGSPESVTRASGGPDEGYGVNARVTYDPVLDTGRLIHIGGSAWRATNFASSTSTNSAGLPVVTNSGVRLSDRPNTRVDGGLIADSGLIGDVKDATFLGAEAAGVYGPFSLQGEYGHLHLDRSGFADLNFKGWYAFGSFFLTGESRSFKNGVIDRLKPAHDFGKSGWGALELAVRYDKLDLGNTPVLARIGNEAESWTGAINWYLNGYTKVMFNWIRFKGDNTPLDPVGDKTEGDAFTTRLHFDF